MDERTILDALVKSGKLDEADIMQVEGLTQDFMDTVDVFHQLLCNGDQASTYIKESQLDSAWDSDAHLYWVKITQKIMKEFGTDTKETIVKLNTVLDVNKSLDKAQFTLLSIIRGSATLHDWIQVHG